MAQVKTEVKQLVEDGWELYTVDEVRVWHETGTPPYAAAG